MYVVHVWNMHWYAKYYIYIYNVTSVDFQTDIATEYIPYMLYFFSFQLLVMGSKWMKSILIFLHAVSDNN
jgi:hypothetical protein